MDTEETGYRSFMLRLWRVKKNGECIWRASLENPRTDQTYNFPNLQALCGFLLNFETIVKEEGAEAGSCVLE